MRWQKRSLASLLLCLAALSGCDEPAISIQPGAAQSYRLPNTANGLQPTQCWYGLGSAGDGSVYIGASDHRSNAALFVRRPGSDQFTVAGDARSASEAADNWQVGETVEKFHVRPTELDGKIHVGSLDYSFYNRGYTRKRGFHWYAFDPDGERFVDLSAAEPNGVASPLQLESLSADPVAGLLYGAGVPTGHLLRYNPATGRTTDLGRPAGLKKKFVEFDSFIWSDRRGQVYFAIEGRGELYDHIHYYDPQSASFGELPEWTFKGPERRQKKPKKPPTDGSSKQPKSRLKTPRTARIPKIGQCSADRQRCYMADNNGRIYRFSEPKSATDEPRWDYLGQVRFPAPDADQLLVTRTFQLDPAERYIYLVNDRYLGTPDVYLHRFEIASGESRVIASLGQLDPNTRAADFNLHCGHDAWDDQGRFYIASFGLSGDGGNAVVTAIDPAKFID